MSDMLKVPLAVDLNGERAFPCKEVPTNNETTSSVMGGNALQNLTKDGSTGGSKTRRSS